MASVQADPFERFAAACGLRVTTEALYLAPRDVVQSPADSDQAFFVTLELAAEPAPTVRLVFLSPLADPAPPSYRDVLWWLASDAWVIRAANGRMDMWAAAHGYPPEEPATARLHGMHLRQALVLEHLLGAERYRELLAIYAAEVSAPDADRLPSTPELN